MHSAGDERPDLSSRDTAGPESVAGGIALSTWFGEEDRRIYSMLGENEAERERRRLVEWITRQGGTTTVRGLQNKSGRYQTAEAAEAALKDLVAVGLSIREPSAYRAEGGRPTDSYHLVGYPPIDETHPNGGKQPDVSVSTGEEKPEETPEESEDDEWGDVT